LCLHGFSELVLAALCVCVCLDSHYSSRCFCRCIIILLMQSKPPAPVAKTSRRASICIAAAAASSSCALQEPWQPATQMLSMADYAAMEGDSAKYERYQLAIVDALCDIILRRAASGTSALRVRILLVGAGRGPLVHRCLTAADIVSAHVMPLRVDIVALERNPDAHSHCVANIASAPASGHSVCFVHADVVCVGAEELRNLCGTDFELVVSELLGSFADNELAPEVLSVVALNTQLLAREIAPSFRSSTRATCIPSHRPDCAAC
jgi:hypothetical protein